MSYTALYAARKIAELDQELAMFNELFTDWINADGNREWLCKLDSSVHYPVAYCFEVPNPRREELVIYLAKSGMFDVQFGDLVEELEEENELIEKFIDWLAINGNRDRLSRLAEDLGDWNRLLIEAFMRPNRHPITIWNCFASYRIRQLTSKALSKIYFTEEPAE
jgi:hypothetical protein